MATQPPPLRTQAVNDDGSISFNWGQFIYQLWAQVQSLVIAAASSGSGANSLPYSAITGTTTSAGTEQVIEATSGTFVLTLTSPTVAAGTAFPLWISNSGAGTVTVSATTNIGSSFSLAANSSVLFMFNGTKWLVF